MKHKRSLLFLLALLLVVGMSVGAAWAYFTANDVAKGGYKLSIGYTPPIYERLDGDKFVRIVSEENAPTVFIRAKAYTGSAYQQYLTYEGVNWKKGTTEDFFYYYMLPLEANSSTTELQVHVTSDLFPAGSQPGEQINIIVVYESAPAIFTETGEPDFTGAWGADAPAAD